VNGHPDAVRLLGVDVGGTKTHLASIDHGGRRRDVVRASSDWRRGHLFSDDRNLPRLGAWIASLSHLDRHTHVVIGLRDCDSDAEIEQAHRVLSRVLGVRVRIENDADLLGPAVGLDHAIAMIVGTGSIVSARDAEGARVTSDGHGWLLGDWGSAPGLVRDAITRVLRASDVAGPTADVLGKDPLVAALLDHFAVSDIAGLAATATITAGPEAWGSAASRVFDAAHLGSALASATVEFAAERLADGVASVIRRGGLGDEVVAAGGVIVHQTMLEESVRARLALMPHPRDLVVVRVPPVEGAVRLAEETPPTVVLQASQANS
jgi:N-acetylglucosamine kinase-like BadF-type ATPase